MDLNEFKEKVKELEKQIEYKYSEYEYLKLQHQYDEMFDAFNFASDLEAERASWFQKLKDTEFTEEKDIEEQFKILKEENNRRLANLIHYCGKKEDNDFLKLISETQGNYHGKP